MVRRKNIEERSEQPRKEPSSAFSDHFNIQLESISKPSEILQGMYKNN